jgi:hypothetical protein
VYVCSGQCIINLKLFVLWELLKEASWEVSPGKLQM